jgi:hypothetical protein
VQAPHLRSTIASFEFLRNPRSLGHSRQNVACAGPTIRGKGTVIAAKTLALTTIDLRLCIANTPSYREINACDDPRWAVDSAVAACYKSESMIQFSLLSFVRMTRFSVFQAAAWRRSPEPNLPFGICATCQYTADAGNRSSMASKGKPRRTPLRERSAELIVPLASPTKPAAFHTPCRGKQTVSVE